jgi:hypothetical protein
MSTRFHFLYRIDMWSSDDAKVIEHLAGAEDFKVAMATYRAACERWPGRTITLSQGARVIESPIRMRQEAILKYESQMPPQSKQPTNAEVKFSRKRISVCGAALPHLIARCIDR